MKYLVASSILSIAVLLCSCSTDQNGNYISSSSNNEGSSGSSESIFKEMSDKVKELDREEGLSVLMKQYKKEDGSTVFDDVLKDIQAHDDASGGQVSSVIEAILGTAEKELGMDVSETMQKAMEHANSVPKELEGNIKDIFKTIEDSGHTGTVNNILEGLGDFLETGGENGGFEKILREVVDMTVEGDPSLADSEFIKEAEEILNNDILDPEKEAERVLKKMLDKNKHLIEQAKQYQ